MPDATQPARKHRRTFRQILKRLQRAHGPRRREPAGSAVDQLVATILSQNTTGANSSAGFDRLKRRFRSWSRAADAPTSQIERCIRCCGLSRQKAPRIRRILRQIRAQRGRISLEFLERRPADDAYEYLLGFDGVGPKTALCVLLFAFAKPVFPVDTHIYRITRRLGVLPDGTPEAKAHEALTPLIEPGDRYAMHVLLIAHGRRTCRARSPECDRCCILKFCPFGEGRLERAGDSA